MGGRGAAIIIVHLPVDMVLMRRALIFCGFCARLGYNHGHECRPITRRDVDKGKAQKNSPYILQLAKL